MEEFARHCKSLKELSIANMHELPKPSLKSIIDFATLLIENQTADQMEELNLSYLSITGDDELTKEEKRLVNALLNSNITKLNRLDLVGNPEWFRNEEAASYLV